MIDEIKNILRIIDTEKYTGECEIRCLINKLRAKRIMNILKLEDPVSICYTSYKIYKNECSLRCYDNGEKEFKMLLYKKKIKDIIKNLDKDKISMREEGLPSDGFILTSRGSYSSKVYKVKDINTIDVEVKHDGKIVDSNILPSEVLQALERQRAGIFEVSLDGKILKERKDKSKSNSLYVIKKTIQWNNNNFISIANSITFSVNSLLNLNFNYN